MRDFIDSALIAAGELLLEKAGEPMTIASKGGDPRDIVTSVDHEVNEFLIARIQAAYPDDAIYSEESAVEEMSGTRLWAIDPIDGSSNFSRGIPHFAITLALLVDAVPVAGAVYNPVTQELFSFARGEGAFLNGAPVEVSKIRTLKESFVLFHAGRKESLRDWGGNGYRALLGSAKKTSNLASTSLDTCFVGCGRVEASVYGTYAPLDVAAAVGFLREAGGDVYDETGAPVGFGLGSTKTYATNSAEIFEELRRLV